MTTDGTTSMAIENSEIPEDPFEKLLTNLANNHNVVCKSQQKDEVDLTTHEKLTILTELLNQNKATFLFRFGQFLNNEELKLFEEFQYNPDTGYEISYHLRHIHQLNSGKCIKNRRYSAVKRLLKDEYFSEREMRKRNPLLYDQLVGLYLSAKEKQIRDIQDRNEASLVGVLMDGIEKEEVEIKRLRQEEAEDAAMEEEEEDDDSSSSENENDELPGSSKQNNVAKHSRQFWGEIQSESEPNKRIRKPVTDKQLSITAQERKLLKEEFYNTMCESFLEGKDDYDYTNIDNNEEYDNLEILNHDEEEKYFDSEEVEDVPQQVNELTSENETSEDELETFMSALNQNPAVSHLADAMKKL